MEIRQYACNICGKRLAQTEWGSFYGRSLIKAGPIGCEGMVLVDAGACSGSVHICEQCEIGLKSFFFAPDGKLNLRYTGEQPALPRQILYLGKNVEVCKD